MSEPIPGLTGEETERLLADLKRDEGWRASPYECSADKLTCGHGILLPFTPSEAEWLTGRRNIWPSAGQSLERWDREQHAVFPLTLEEGEWLLRRRAAARVEGLRRRTATLGIAWGGLPSDVRVALSNMAFQLGSAGVMRFRRMVSALKRKDYVQAATEALDSLWARQTPARAKRMAALIRGSA